MSAVDHAVRRLRSEEPSERLEAARYLAGHAGSEQLAAINEALGRETVVWIKGALRRALGRLADGATLPGNNSLDEDDVPEGIAAQVHADALETTTAQLIHEIEPLVGTLKLAAQSEIAEYDTSKTKAAVERIDDFLEALSRLRRAAGAPKMEEFDLAQLVEDCLDQFPDHDGLVIHRVGTSCIVVGDNTLVRMCVLNGLRNAVEATEALGALSDERPVTIAWGSTDSECWISVVDLGIGFKGNTQRAFEMGTSTKNGHMGMGLAISKQSAESMLGRIFLVPNARGTRFEVRWPLPPADK